MEEQIKHPEVAAIFTKLLEAMDMNAAQFAKRIGSTPQAISNYVTGRNEPGRKMMAAIIHAFPAVNASWLATGEGNPIHHGRSATEQRPMPNALLKVVKSESEQATLPAPTPGLTSGPATVAEAENVLLREQVADLKQQVAKLWTLNGISEKLGKLLSSSDAAWERFFVRAGQSAGTMQPA